MSPWEVRLHNRAIKQLIVLDRGQQDRFWAAFQDLGEHGLAARLDLRPLEGQPGHWRLRVGRYRAVFAVEGNVLYVTKIGHRHAIYRL